MSEKKDKTTDENTIKKSKKSLTKRIFGITWKVLLGIVILLVLLILSLRIPAVQNYVKDRAVTYLQDKIKTKVQLDKIYVGFPKTIQIKNLYLQGQQVDTLLAVKDFNVGLNLVDLLSNKVTINSIDLQGTRANVVRDKAGKFNFDYIIDAFASDEKDESPSKPWIISLDKIHLEDIGVSFIDQQAQNNLNVYFKSFNTSIKEFDLEKNNYAINDIKLDGLRLKLKQDLLQEVAKKVKETAPDPKAQPLKIALKGIELTNFDIDYADENSKTYAKIDFEKFVTEVKKLDLAHNDFEIGKISLQNATIFADLELKNNPDSTQVADSTKANDPMKLVLGRMNLDNVKVVYNNTAVQKQPRGLDYNHLDFSKLNVDLRDFKMMNGGFSGKIKSAEISEKSGLNIEELHTDFVYAEKEAYLKDLYLETPQTVLRDNIVLNYNSLQQLTNNPGGVKIMANIKNSKIGFHDILTLVPTLRNTAPFNKYPTAILNVDTHVEGLLNDLTIEKFSLTGFNGTVVRAAGKIKNAMDPDHLWFDLKVPELKTNAKTIYNLVPAGTIPNNISLPENLALNGTAVGSTKDLRTNLKLRTSYGNADILANVDMRRKDAERYAIKANLHQLNVGKLIKNKEVGVLDGKVDINGTGFNPETLAAKVDGSINSFYYNGYDYHHVNLTGGMKRGAYTLNLTSKDPNANLKMQVAGVYKKDQMTVKADGDILKLDLMKLGFYKDPMIIAGQIAADFSDLNPDNLNGNLHLQNFALSNSKDVFPMQEVQLEAISNAQGNEIHLASQVVDFNMVGKYNITQIADALKETISQYYQLGSAGAKKKKIAPHQHFVFDGKIKNDALVQRFVPELKDFETITLNGNFDADTQKLNLDAAIPSLTYGDNHISDGKLTIGNQGEKLAYALNIQQVKSEKLRLDKVAVVGDLANDVLTYSVSTKDADDKTQMLVAGTAKTMNDILEISLDEDGFILDHDPWNVAPDNYIRISPKGIVAHNFTLSQDGSKISLNSESEQANSPLNVEIANFKIEKIAEIIKKDSLPARGSINGTAQIRDLKNQMTFNADMKVSDLHLMGNPVGDVTAVVNNRTKDIIDADIKLSGNGNDASVTGTYNTKASAFDLDLLINQLQMKTAEALSMGNLENTEGFISGKMKIAGTSTAPQIRGQLDFNKVAVGITKTGSLFKNINDAIYFTAEGITFRKFKIDDPAGNSMYIDGKIKTKDYRDYAFGLQIKSKNFRVVDSKEDASQLLYGILAIDANLNIGGDLDLPKVDGDLHITDQTDITFVVPQSNPHLQAREGIVEFIDQDQLALQETIKADSVVVENKIKGLDVSVNIDISKKAKTSLLIDKANGDFIKMQGEGQLTGGIDPSGKTTLVGVYQVEEGAYEMSISMLKRKFKIQKGSTITWTGDPTSAELDITAIYETKAAPIDLLEQQLGSDSSVNQYKQKIPFYTKLIMKGELMKPELSFDITTDETNNSISSEVLDNTKTKLEMLRNDTSEMNKQVFALLLLNRFIGEDPFHSQSGVSASTMVKQSVSRLLSEQLNNLVGGLIEGVDVNFDLESSEDYTSGEQKERTDLNVDISKKLLNDRLTVTVGSNFGVEGDARQNEKTTNIAGNVALDYALSRDGRYKLRVYRKDEYQVALQGQVIETGVGFIITLDYDHFREIFRKRKKNQEMTTDSKE